MSAATIIFYLLGAVAVAAGLVILFTRNLIYAAYSLVVILLCIAGWYVIADADFIAITQVMVYAGGVLVLIIFGIMLTNRAKGTRVLSPSHFVLQGFFAFVILGVLFYNLWQHNRQWVPDSTAKVTAAGHAQNIGVLLMTDYLFAFELAGILLLVAVMGAAILASKNHKRT